MEGRGVRDEKNSSEADQKKMTDGNSSLFRNTPEHGMARKTRANCGRAPLGVNTLAAIIGLLLSGCSDAATNGCVDVALGPILLSVPQRHLTPRTPHKSNSGNFIFPFDSSMPGIDCPVGCKELFANISYKGTSTPEQQWIFGEPKFTGRSSGKYRVYLSRFDWGNSKPLVEILVPSDAVNPQEEFYSCTAEGRVANPGCHVTIVAKSGLVARFSVPRKVLAKARDAASYVTQSIDQFSENHFKGICK